MQVFFIRSSANTAVHRQLRIEVVYCLLVGHAQYSVLIQANVGKDV